MCISVPARVTAVTGNSAQVEVNAATKRVLICADGVEVGSWVLVYGGAAIAVLDSAAAEETRALLARMIP